MLSDKLNKTLIQIEIHSRPDPNRKSAAQQLRDRLKIEGSTNAV